MKYQNFLRYIILKNISLGCDQCMGLDDGHKCSDAGDCMNNECMCDEDFSAHDCHLGRKFPLNPTHYFT